VLRIIYNTLKLIFWKAEIREVSFAELKTTYVFDRRAHMCLQKYTTHLKILGAAVKNFVAIVTWCSGFVHLSVRWVMCFVLWKFEVWSCSWHSVARWAVTKLCKATGSSETFLVYHSTGLHRIITQNATVKGILYSWVRYWRSLTRHSIIRRLHTSSTAVANGTTPKETPCLGTWCISSFS
jgi:hypothetical protein